ncbi:glycosyltransferase involved in cell wall biosynthesis [Nonomuraea muscovyensis]|uniref:Glycosyltransferase involved in cell wall biosynthesis n=1 Tax=Nonomuraea muscovyensis TaxID=1124761 RepID=A0A7X0F0H5_9ACTN|nr:glycosyltransferase [Nonomuraea muscovyensis]MBB6351302.1 glycosyltransferase involved in cell wall biosynthesis [Nonomuraea muscovyensis]
MTAGGRDRLRRAVLLIGHLGMGGTQKQVSLLAQELRHAGTEPHVMVLSRGGPYEATLHDAGIEVHRLGFGRGSPLGNARAYARLVGVLRRLAPEVVHTFLHEATLIGVPAARLARVPVVVAGRRNETRLNATRPWSLALDRMTARMADHVVVNAAALAADACAMLRLPRHSLTVIYNGLPPSAFDPVPPEEVRTGLPVVACVARLSAEKGHCHLIDAMALLAARGRPCTLVLAGDGPERGALEKQAAAAGLDVRFLGTRTDNAELLARADVVVLASLTEGLSNAVMEAMAAGRPIVATSVGGNPELLDERGVLVPPAAPSALAEGVIRLLDDPGLAGGLAAAARAWAGRNLDTHVMADHHLRLYERLLRARRAG